MINFLKNCTIFQNSWKFKQYPFLCHHFVAGKHHCKLPGLVFFSACNDSSYQSVANLFRLSTSSPLCRCKLFFCFEAGFYASFLHSLCCSNDDEISIDSVPSARKPYTVWLKGWISIRIDWFCSARNNFTPKIFSLPLPCAPTPTFFFLLFATVFHCHIYH